MADTPTRLVFAAASAITLSLSYHCTRFVDRTSQAAASLPDGDATKLEECAQILLANANKPWFSMLSPGCTANFGHLTTAEEEWSTDPYGRTMLHAPLEGDPSLDPPRSSGDTGSVWIGSSVEEQGPPAPRLASAAGGTPITAPHVPAPPRRGSERCGARDSSKDHRRSIGAAGSATIGTSGEIKIQPRRPS
ncbi:hypothetical protein THAOC_27019 [Thalassiosira oceanica]|uniref:Uncharacterized protein n=1 Tax=Thalassiosira oceanica TaxID=159749 RepID=K0RII6_THAOC|nr:hypothetical protein THAOC_27019 [Thalassiosira oceanica]|eukprot:EJK53528.1 hypothetical protein THAOC_27019 [Thalassiosira oceanica]